MRRRAQKILRWTGLGAAIVAGLVVLVLLAAYGILQSEAGRAHVVELLNRQLSTPGVTEVRIGRLDGDLPSRVEIRDVTVADRDGVWLRVDFVGATWRPLKLLAGRVAVSMLEIDGLTALRKPISAESQAEFEWPEVPVRVSVEQFSLEQGRLEQALLGERVAFRATGDSAIEGPDRITTRVAVTRTDGVSGHAQLAVSFQPRSNFLGFELALNEAEGGVLARALDFEGLPSISVQIDGEGPLDGLRGNARLRAGDLVFVESGFTMDVSARPALEIDGRARIARLVQAPIRDLLVGDVTFQADAAITERGVRLRHATLASALAHVELSGELDDFAAELDAKVALSDLVPLASTAGLPLQGRASIETRIRSDDIRRGATGSVDATLSDPLPSASPLQAALGSRVSVAGTFEFEVDRYWAVRGLALSGEAVQLNANATLAADTSSIDGDYRLSVPELAALTDQIGAPVAGKAGVAGNIGGSLAQPNLTAHVTSPALSIDQVPLGAVDARLNISQMVNGLSGSIDLSLDNARIGTVSVASRFSGDPGDSLRLDGLVMKARDASVEGVATIKVTDGIVTGRLEGRELALATWSDLAGRALSGNVDATLDLRGDKTQEIDLSMSARKMTVAMKPQQLLAIDVLQASARIDDAFGSPKGGVRGELTDVQLPGTYLASAVVEMKIQDRRHVKGRLQTHGTTGAPFELETVVEYTGIERRRAVTFSEFDASFAGQRIVLTKPATLTHEADTTTLSRSTFSVAEGRLSVDGSVGKDRIAANLELDAISLATLSNAAAVADLTGSLSGRARVSGTRGAPFGELELRIDDVRATHATLAGVPPSAGRLRGDWRDGRLQLTGNFALIGQSALEARASVPLRLDAESLAPAMPADEAIDGELRWSGDLGPIWDLLSPYEDRFTGPGELAFDLVGTVGNPQASGHFRVTGGSYENVHSGSSLENVDLRLAGSGDKLVVETLSATDGKSGTLAGGGTIGLQPAEDYPTNLRLEFSNMLLVARDDLILNADGKFSLEGTLSSALLSGEIVTGSSELSLAGTLPPQVVELDVKEVNIDDATQAREQAPAGAGEPSVVILDLDITVPGRAFVRGLGLDSEWQGEVKISGDANAPNVSGVLSPVRGHFALMGKRFRLESGAIRFTGSDDVDPLLDLTAEHVADNLTAIVHVTGSASQPKVTLTSRPPLPESEIASQVLFGTESSKLTTAQSLQLASAIATYSGQGGAVGILDSTRRALGVDVIGFRESEADPDTTRVSVGKYVTDGVYLEVEAGTEEASRTTTTVEVEVLPNVRVEGGTTEEGGNKVGVKWRWDY